MSDHLPAYAAWSNDILAYKAMNYAQSVLDRLVRTLIGAADEPEPHEFVFFTIAKALPIQVPFRGNFLSTSTSLIEKLRNRKLMPPALLRHERLIVLRHRDPLQLTDTLVFNRFRQSVKGVDELLLLKLGSRIQPTMALSGEAHASRAGFY